MPTVQEQIEDLEEEVQKLENRKSEVDRRAREADDQAIGSIQQYDEWIKKAEAIVMESNTFIDEVRNPHAKCYFKLWYNKPYQNRIIRKAAYLRKAVNNHYGEMPFDEAETPSTLENLSHQIEVISRDKLLCDILNYLQNDEVNIIGVYGTAGVGKTDMVERIIRQAKNEKLFDVVVKATTPRDFNVMSIQNQIAEEMKLKFDAMKTMEQRAEQLGHALLMKRDNKEKVLVILEDIGQEIGFVAPVVAPLSARCKLVITSQFNDILKEGPMKADRIVNLEVLDEEEARDLFLKTLRVEDNSQLECLLEYCGGLPLAIVTIASALRDKNTYHWKYAADLLKDGFGEKTDGACNRVPEIVELSFYYLRDKEAQLLLLFCCLFPEETPIELERLMGYCLGMHLFEANCSLEIAMVRLYGLLTRLISCNFLSTVEDSDGFYYVQMSDAVRQVAISIASREEYNFSVDPCWPMEKEQASKHAISQCFRFEDEYDEGDSGALEWQFVNLEILCLRNTSIEDKKIEPDGFFKGKELLKVLDICCRYTGLDLNSQLHLLRNLRSLRLIASSVKGLSEIGQLTNLEYLYIAVDSMKELPTTFMKLTQLQVLDLSRSGLLQIIPAKVIGSLSKLRGLLLNTRVTHSVIRLLFPRINLVELKSCRHLKVLEAVLTVNDDPRTNHIISEVEPILSLLLSFKLIISSNPTRGKWGDGFDDIERKGLNKLFPKALHLHHINLGSPIKFQEMSSLWKNLQLLCCVNVEGLHDMQDKFLGLRVLLLSRCKDIKYLAKTNVKFTKLEFLVLQRLPNLERICEQEEALWKDCFPELREIYLEGLPNMKYNPSSNSDTNSVRYLFGAEDDLKNVELVSVTSLNCKEIWHFPVPVDSFSKLRTIKIYKMPELRSLFPSLTFCAKLLQKVQTLDIRLCEKLVAVIEENDDDMFNTNISVFPKLEKMSLLTLPSLLRFHNGSHNLQFPALQRVYVGHCPMMDSFSTAGTPITPRLTDNKGVKIGDLNQLVKGKY